MSQSVESIGYYKNSSIAVLNQKSSGASRQEAPFKALHTVETRQSFQQVSQDVIDPVFSAADKEPKSAHAYAFYPQNSALTYLKYKGLTQYQFNQRQLAPAVTQAADYPILGLDVEA